MSGGGVRHLAPCDEREVDAHGGGEGDWAIQPIKCQRVTGVRVFGKGTARYPVELHADSRREEN